MANAQTLTAEDTQAVQSPELSPSEEISDSTKENESKHGVQNETLAGIAMLAGLGYTLSGRHKNLNIAVEVPITRYLEGDQKTGVKPDERYQNMKRVLHEKVIEDELRKARNRGENIQSPEVQARIRKKQSQVEERALIHFKKKYPKEVLKYQKQELATRYNNRNDDPLYLKYREAYEKDIHKYAHRLQKKLAKLDPNSRKAKKIRRKINKIKTSIRRQYKWDLATKYGERIVPYLERDKELNDFHQKLYTDIAIAQEIPVNAIYNQLKQNPAYMKIENQIRQKKGVWWQIRHANSIASLDGQAYLEKKTDNIRKSALKSFNKKKKNREVVLGYQRAERTAIHTPDEDLIYEKYNKDIEASIKKQIKKQKRRLKNGKTSVEKISSQEIKPYQARFDQYYSKKAHAYPAFADSDRHSAVRYEYQSLNRKTYIDYINRIRESIRQGMARFSNYQHQSQPQPEYTPPPPGGNGGNLINKINNGVKNIQRAIKAAKYIAQGAKAVAMAANPAFWIGLGIVLGIIILIIIIVIIVNIIQGQQNNNNSSFQSIPGLKLAVQAQPNVTNNSTITDTIKLNYTGTMNLIITDILPVGTATYVSSNPTGTPGKNNTLTWNLNTITPTGSSNGGQDYTITVTFQPIVQNGGKVTNNVYVEPAP